MDNSFVGSLFDGLIVESEYGVAAHASVIQELDARLLAYNSQHVVSTREAYAVLDLLIRILCVTA